MINPQTVQLSHAGNVTDTRVWSVVPYKPDALQLHGRTSNNPGFRIQVIRLFTTPAPGPDVVVGDELVVGGETYFTALIGDGYPRSCQVVAWMMDYPLTVNILDTTGVAVLSAWPAIIDALDIQPRASAGIDPRQEPTAILTCQPDDAINPGYLVVVSTVVGQTATGFSAATYEILTRADEYSLGHVASYKMARRK